ncbi:MAG: antibiotic biosynthesis monooxygenase [Crocinitomicaceae bacterium]|nr:antibiotic biosynthesis monooxygenase [Crocinitomicaceae bacterium]
MTFEENKINDFLTFFDSIKHIVNNFPGCNGMQLLQDKQHPFIVFTYSNWQDESNLETYRNSDDFKRIWSTIKPWFAQKAEAWSVDVHFNGFKKKS